MEGLGWDISLVEVVTCGWMCIYVRIGNDYCNHNLELTSYLSRRSFFSVQIGINP